jgi:L-iditol 2-dehydrogenase
MKAAVLHKGGIIRYEDWPDPRLKSGEVLVRVRAAGICGSDLPRVLSGKAHYYPIVLGHEFSGDVVKVNGGTGRITPGMRVSGVPLVPCMACSDCARGDYALCRHYTFIGSRVQGSFAEYVALPETNVVPFDSAVSYEQGALFEPSAVALHGLLQSDWKPGEETAVLGGGTIGQFTAQWARIMGAKDVTVFDLEDSRLELATRLGAAAGINTRIDGFMDEALARTDGKGFGMVFETAGSVATMRMAFELAANKAGVCFIGTPHEDLSYTPALWEQMNRKEFKLTGSWMSYSAPFPGMEWTLTAHAFKKGTLRYDEDMIYRTFPLHQAQEAFDLYRTPGTVQGKVLFLLD